MSTPDEVPQHELDAPGAPRWPRFLVAGALGSAIAVAIYAFGSGLARGPWSAAPTDPTAAVQHEVSSTAVVPLGSVSAPTEAQDLAPDRGDPGTTPAAAAGEGVPLSEDAAKRMPAPVKATAPAVPRDPPPPPVSITFKTVPSAVASVTWGKEELGTIQPGTPLVVQRPRDSGPLDVVIKARGCLPVNARAYTFADNIVEVRITPRGRKSALYGYRVPLPPLPDAGVIDTPGL